MKKLLLVSVDGLTPELVEAYGSNIGQTPTLNRLASQGLLFDQCFADALHPAEQLVSFITGTHQLQRRQRPLPPKCLEIAEQLVITDCVDAAQKFETFGCESVQFLDNEHGSVLTDVPSNVGETNEPTSVLEEIFFLAAENLQNTDADLVWLHSRGLSHPWDAPSELRAQFADPDDPQPPSEICVPQLEIGIDTDPDLVVGWTQVAAAQVAIIDRAIETVLTSLSNRSDQDEWLICIIGFSGFSLGEQDTLGWQAESFTSNLLRNLAIVATLAEPTCATSTRLQKCLQLPTVAHFLRRLCLSDDTTALMGSTPVSALQDHEVAIAASEHEFWIHVPAWSGRWQTAFHEAHSDWRPGAEDACLFAKPDDRWEVSNVAAIRPDILSQLRDLFGLRASELLGEDVTPPTHQRLDKELVSPIR